MAGPALREQLSSYIARRVTSQAKALVQIHEQCVQESWKDPDLNGQLLDASGKLNKLAKKLPHRPYAEISQKISSLLKFEHDKGEPLHRTRLEVRESILKISRQLEAEDELNKDDQALEIKNIAFALNDKATADALVDSFKQGNLDSFRFNPNAKIDANTCLVIDIDYGSRNQGFEIAKAFLNNKHTAAIFVSEKRNDLETRLRVIRHQGHDYITGKLSARRIATSIRENMHAKVNIKPHILIVEDSVSQLKYAENMLLTNQFGCTALSNPAELLNVLDDVQPDLILLDMYLPNCNGLELAQVLQQHPTWKNLPIIFLSAEESEEITKQAKSATNAPFLTKPVKAKALIHEIQLMLGSE